MLGVHQQRVGTHQSAGLQASINCTANKNLTQSFAVMVSMARQAAHAKTGDGVARQFFLLRVTEVLGANLGRTQCIKAHDLTGLRGVHQYKNRIDSFGILLRRVFLQEIIQGKFTTLKAGAVMLLGVKNLLFKHA